MALETLWHAGHAVVPAIVRHAYEAELEARGWLGDAIRQHVPGRTVAGGEDAGSTREHFTHRFVASVVRPQLLVLDPDQRFGDISTDLAAVFLDGRVTVLDLPCGTGGGLFGLLGTLAELRRLGRRPRTPLDVSVIAGDISEDARQIHASVAARLAPGLAQVGIRTAFHHTRWDVTNPFDTSRVVDEWFDRSPGAEHHFVLMSAFSDFASQHVAAVQQAIQTLVGRCHNRRLTLLLVEPASNDGRKWLDKLTDAFVQTFRALLGRQAPEAWPRYGIRHPLGGQDYHGGLKVRVYDRRW